MKGFRNEQHKKDVLEMDEILKTLCMENFSECSAIAREMLQIDGKQISPSFKFDGDVIGRNRFSGKMVKIPAKHASWLLATYLMEKMEHPSFGDVLDKTVDMVSGEVYMAMLD